LVEVQAVSRRPLAAPGDVHPTGLQIPIQERFSGPQLLQTRSLYSQLRLGAVAALQLAPTPAGAQFRALRAECQGSGTSSSRVSIALVIAPAERVHSGQIGRAFRPKSATHSG
jgi:hypothetical protein